VKYPILLVLSC